MKKALLIAAAASALMSFTGLAQAQVGHENPTMQSDGGPSGRLHEGRTAYAPRFHVPFVAPYHHYRHRWWDHGQWHYRY